MLELIGLILKYLFSLLPGRKKPATRLEVIEKKTGDLTKRINKTRKSLNRRDLKAVREELQKILLSLKMKRGKNVKDSDPSDDNS